MPDRIETNLTNKDRAFLKDLRDMGSLMRDASFGSDYSFRKQWVQIQGIGFILLALTMPTTIWAMVTYADHADKTSLIYYAVVTLLTLLLVLSIFGSMYFAFVSGDNSQEAAIDRALSADKKYTIEAKFFGLKTLGNVLFFFGTRTGGTYAVFRSGKSQIHLKYNNKLNFDRLIDKDVLETSAGDMFVIELTSAEDILIGIKKI